MSIRVDSSPLIAGSVVVGVPGLGVLAELVPAVGEHGPGYLKDRLTPADNGKEVRGLITRWPTNGTLVAYEDSSFEYTGTSDTFEDQLYVDGSPRGAPVTHTITIGAAAETASGSTAALSLAAPTGTSSTFVEVTASGSLAPLSLGAPVGSAAVISSVTGAFAQISLTAPTGTASTVTETLAVGPVSELNLSAPFGFVTATGLAEGYFAAIALSAITAKSGTDSLDDLVYQLLANRQELDPVLGEFIVYDVDGVTIKWRAKAWEDANATQPYRGGALRRIDKLELL